MSIRKPHAALPLVMLAGTLALAPGCWPPPVEHAQMRKGPYLLYPGDNTSMAVLWQTKQTPRTAKIMWGSTRQCQDGSAVISQSGAGTDEHQFSYTITGLTPGARTYYQVNVDGQLYTGSFRTAPKADANSLTFYAYGDTRTSPASQDVVLARLLSDMDADFDTRQTLCLHAGDFVHYGMEESYWDAEFFDPNYTYIQTFLTRVPLMACLGNHELYYSTYHPPDPTTGGRLFRKYWPYVFLASTPPFYYSFDYGPLHVSVVDNYTASNNVGTPQVVWLDGDLAGTSKAWKIVLFHRPVWTAADENDVTTLDARAALCPIFENRGVKVVVQGHEHYYARATVNGVQYLTLGGGGAPLVAPDPNASNLVKSDQAYHFGRFDISGTSWR